MSTLNLNTANRLRMEDLLRQTQLSGMQEALVPHIFFPRRLPSESTDDEIINTESALLELFSGVIENVSNLPISKTRKLFTSWKSIQPKEGFNIHNLTIEIQSMEPGDSIVLYIRAQNAGLMFTMPKDDDTSHDHGPKQMILSAFAASQSNETVMGAEGFLRSIFPGYSYHIPKSALLESNALAEQLSILCKNVQDYAAPHSVKSSTEHEETRNVRDPIFLTQWLPAVLSVETSDLCLHFKPILKKIRDHVVHGNSTLPFRRSGLWMTAKVALQLSLTNELENEAEAKVLYKIIMLKLFVTCSNIWSQGLCADVGMQAIAKIVKRILKLHDLIGKGTVSDEMTDYFRKIVAEAQESVFKIKSRLDAQWKSHISDLSTNSELNYTPPSDFQEDTIHQLKRLTTYLEMLKDQKFDGLNRVVPNLPCPPRHRSGSSMFPIAYFEETKEEHLGIVLNDFERNIATLETFYTNSDAEVLLLRNLFEKYAEKAESYYKDDPVGGSRMILTLLNIIMVLHKAAIREHPLLAEHKSGIDPSCIQELLLPGRKEMERALKIEEYFSSRNSAAMYPSLIGEHGISSCSFSVRYASRSIEMQQLKQEILTECKKREEEKKDEVLRKREECREWRQKADGLCHEYQWNYGVRSCKSNCDKCYYENLANRGVNVHERMLPKFDDDADEDRNGVVFELRMPSDLVCLRDMLFKFSRLCSNIQLGGSSAFGFWVNHLGSYQRPSAAQKYVKLGSSTKLFVNTHYDRINLHPDTDLGSFVVDNGYNCQYFYNDNSNLPAIPNGSTIKSFCTFSINSDSPYKNLEFALKGSSHTQNQVLARQIECPSELSLTEFIEFGSLRAGHRLEWHNIHRAIAQGSLSLEAEAVFSLICQTIWQAGPRAADATTDQFWRESDESILDPNFAMETLKLLYTEVEKNSLNWKNYYFMAVIIVLSSRIFSISMTADVQAMALELLRNCRRVTTEWCDSIEDLLSRMTLAPKEDVKEMRTKLVQIAALSALTFVANPNYLSRVLKNSKDVHSWLRAISKIHDNILLTESSLAELPKMLRNILRWVRLAGVELEMHFHELNGGYSVELGFNSFVCEQLSNSELFIEYRDLEYEADSEQVLRCEKKDSVYQMDIITGRFYVNGKPIGKLPYTITENTVFQRIFSGTIFEARDATEADSRPGSLSTVLKFNKCIYNFFVAKELLIVTEIHEDGMKYQLIPHSQFVGDLPYLLIHNFSHWRNLKTNVIDFRPIDFLHPNFISSPEYTLDRNTKILLHPKTNRNIVDINTTSFRNMSQIMERLEHINHMLIFSDDKRIIAELPRMALNFTVDKSGLIESKEYSGMHISTRQHMETLIGLENGILLKSKEFDENTSAPILLVPNGQLSISKSSSAIHPSVRIATETLNHPEYFAFEVDTRLKRLRAGQSRNGWLYLAYLHAVTASPLPDPFLDMTGTEAALQLLQSPLCWSCEPLEHEAVSILMKISELSPHRVYYPAHLKVMERNSYRDGLTSAATQDSFRMIVQKILTDSQRLNFLFPNHEALKNEPDSGYNQKLCMKAYRKHSQLTNEHCKLDPSFLLLDPPAPDVPVSSVSTHLHQVDTTDVRTLAHLCATWTCQLGTDNAILTKLLGNKDRVEFKRMSPSSEFFTRSDLFKNEFPGSWFNLYEIARLVEEKSWKCEWSLLLGQLAFGNKPIPMNHLLLLHSIAVNPLAFKTLDLPPYEVYTNTCKYEFNSNEVKSAVTSCGIGFETYFSRYKDGRYRDSDDQRKYVNRLTSEYNAIVQTEAGKIAEVLSPQWPIPSCSSISFPLVEVVDMSHVKSKLETLLSNWYTNLQLHDFLVKVEELVQTMPTGTVHLHPYDFPEFESHRSLNFEIPYNQSDVLQGNTLNDLIQETQQFVAEAVAACAREAFETGQNMPTKTTGLSELGLLSNSKLNPDYLLNVVKTSLLTSTDSLPYKNMLLAAAGLFPRLTPTTLIPKICSDMFKENRIRDLLGATVVIWTLNQKQIRCLKLERAGSMEFALKKEKQNDGHNFWSPEERPEWLLLELEMDIMIREIQVEVAERMLHPPENESSLMQLNMGEGKTSVILPILVASLANGEQLARVTVLKSLFHTNTEVLRFNLGGLLQRRLYNLPCRRDMTIEASDAQSMLEVYKECVQKRGFVVTLPEHRLSFQLKGFEKCRSGSADAGPLVEVQEWLYKNARDVLDESDEILNVKYQLIYTVGSHDPIDGQPARWTVVQNVLKLVSKHLKSMIPNEEGINDLAECRHMDPNFKGHPEIFPKCRVFKERTYKKLCKALAKDVLKGNSEVQFQELNSKMQKRVVKFVTKPSISRKLHSQVLKAVNKNATSTFHLNTLLILRGLFASGVLQLGLTKRWRVNYGENPKSKELKRLMAVPYRAKDVASEKTEFGHPDVAILLTQLSYYYSGLTDAQLTECFVTLFRQSKPELEYAYWIEKMKNVHVHSSISSLSGVNLDDYEQRTKILFPALRRNMFVIDFWLHHFVFPRETKVFGHKLMCSPWDLSSNIAVHPITGFSGTNDTAALLPPHIFQRDLPKLRDTNEKVRGYILGEENNFYEALPVGFTGLDILKKLVQMKIPLLLDVGALILELSNLQVAEEWLKLIPTEDRREAAVYFDSMDRLMVKDRDGRESPLELSPYRTRLGQCVIYLDDAHTRGTDLKMPVDTKGCVTLGKGVTRDKLVQGCMRMRLLGNGHSLRFMASQEVHNEICALVDDNSNQIPTWNLRVFNWAEKNSQIAIQEGFLHWVNAGVNYIRKEAAHDLFNSSIKSRDDFVTYGNRCSDAEATDLMAMYGDFRQEELFVNIADSRLRSQERSFMGALKLAEEKRDTTQIKLKLLAGRDAILSKCKKHIPNVKKLAGLLDEEQERELDHLKEEERQAPRPPSAEPYHHVLMPELINFIQGGSFEAERAQCWIPVPKVFELTSLWQICQPKCWGENIFATQDFSRVVKQSNENDSVDQYLRPPTWLASFSTEPGKTKSGLIFLSPFEANELIPIFRSGKSNVTLHMFAPRLFPKQNTLLRSPKLWIPSSELLPNYFEDENHLNSNLLLFTGSQYFLNEEEQTAYCQLTGFIPRPRTDVEQKAFNEGWTVNGFVKHEYREQLNLRCQFLTSPEELILKIISQRHEGYSAKCHVSRVVADSTKERFEEEHCKALKIKIPSKNEL